jgi:phospholipase/carboxylesterase
LLVMMHGYGTDESRMVRLFEYLPQEFTFAALRAPMPIGDHWGWFLLDYFLANDFADVISAATSVRAWISSVRDQHSSVTLMGYSQGMAMATTLLRLHPDDYKAVVGLSGFVLNNELLSTMDSFETKKPFFWGAGQGGPGNQRRRHLLHRRMAGGEHVADGPDLPGHGARHVQGRDG